MYNDGTKKWLNTYNNSGNQIAQDGSIRAIGTAVVYDDIVGDLMGKKLSTTSGRVDYNWDENFIKFQNNGDITDRNDRVQFNVQLPHKAVVGINSYFKFHIHHFQEDTIQRTLTLQYRIQNNGEAKDTTWHTITLTTNDGNDLFTYTSGILNQITTFPVLDTTGADISSTIQIRVARTDGNSGDLNVCFLDAHVLIDSDGSTTEWSKD